MFNSFRTEIKWALIFVATMLAWMLLERVIGLHDTHIDKHAIYTNFFAIPAIAVYVFALLDKRKNDYNGVMNYKQGFLSGLIITVIVTVLTPITQYITTVVITPDFFTNIIEYSVQQGEMTREAAEGQFNTKNYIIMGMVGALIMGILTTSVVAFFTKKNTPTRENDI
ncbi:DUF4199 domain-containing protein [Aliifodinibius salicampi]|uniref:DUF4199 domain-containing protein n=1 Tax=Fodinibius salicampi TaxID=1920655 RepID=A0ABT3Q1D2_9BACT|nr:DUF4199 domain-containing protein [Fodinibius salicampi]MCW9713910.1 DUF4199 domain-containing protein [Fodinibius salicampi]